MTTSPKSAVLVIDMQNDTVHVDGAYASSGAAEHAKAQNVVGNVGALLDAARANGTPVFYSRIVVYPLVGHGGDSAPIFRMLAPGTFKLDSWGAQIVDQLTPKPGDVVLDRTRMSVFNRAPRATDATTSAPDMIPVSRWISVCAPTWGSRWNGIGARSSCRGWRA